MEANRAPDRGEWLGRVAVMVAGLAACLLQLRILAPDHDNAYLLDVAGRMLSGGRYFHDFMELNPPLYSILLFPAHGLSATGLPLYSAFIIWISILITAATVAIFGTLRPLIEEGVAARAAISVGVLAALFVVPATDFGQRDHLALVLFLPALVWQAGRRRGRVTAAGWAVVIAAALGVLIKPYLVLAVAGAYAVRLAEERDWRLLIEPPVWCFAAIACLYVGLIFLAFPEWFLVAEIAQSAYSAFDGSEWIGRREVVTAVAIAVLAGANEVFGRQGERRLGRVLAAATAGALGSYVLQHKSIEYHFIPARTLVWLLVGLVALEGIRWLAALPLPAGLRRWQAMASRYRVLLLCLVAVLPFYRLADRTVLDERRVDDSMRTLVAVLEANRIGPRIAVFGTSVYPAYPLSLYRESLPAWRFAQPWMIPWIVQQGRAGRADAPETMKMSAAMRRLVIEDFERYKPDAILVDETPEKLFLPKGFDIMAWFRQDPTMAAILDKYQRVAVFDDPNERVHFRRLAVYRRL
jgi:hypothetical protein